MPDTDESHYITVSENPSLVSPTGKDTSAGIRGHGFGPPCACYLNDDASIAYARQAPDGGRLSQPLLFVIGDFDQVCMINGNRQGDPMRAACPDLTVVSLPAGHWLPLECKADLTRVIRTFGAGLAVTDVVKRATLREPRFSQRTFGDAHQTEGA